MNTQSNSNDDMCGEPIDVARIRLMGPCLKHAVLGELRAADRMVSSWIASAQHGQLDYEYEVVFLDGYVFKGKHSIASVAKRQQLFSSHLRKAFDAIKQSMGSGLADRYVLNLA